MVNRVAPLGGSGVTRRATGLEEFFADLARNPQVREVASAFFYEGVLPRARQATATVRRALRFPACQAGGTCGNTGVGRCHICASAFCVHHGLVLLGDQLDEQLQATIRQPVSGLCATCVAEGVKAAKQAFEAAQGFGVGGFARTGFSPPPPQDGGPQPYDPRAHGFSPPYAGYGYQPPPPSQQPETPPPLTLEVSWALVTLGLEQNATLLDVKRAYKALAQKLHPDVGGSHEAMTNLNRAKVILERALRRGG